MRKISSNKKEGNDNDDGGGDSNSSALIRANLFAVLLITILFEQIVL